MTSTETGGVSASYLGKLLGQLLSDVLIDAFAPLIGPILVGTLCKCRAAIAKEASLNH